MQLRGNRNSSTYGNMHFETGFQGIPLAIQDIAMPFVGIKVHDAKLPFEGWSKCRTDFTMFLELELNINGLVSGDRDLLLDAKKNELELLSPVEILLDAKPCSNVQLSD